MNPNNEQSEKNWLGIYKHLSTYVVPLFAHEKNRPQFIGSGFFVKVDHRNLLVSAAHVFDIVFRGYDLFYYVEPDQFRIIDGEYLGFHLLEGKTRNDDKIDIAAVVLADHNLPPYPAVNKCTVPTVLFEPFTIAPHNKPYLFLGYPASKSKLNPTTNENRSTGHLFLAHAIRHEQYKPLGLNEAWNIAMRVDLKRGQDIHGGHQHSPNPHGMSGSPLWRPGTAEEGGPKLVGVMIEYRHNAKLVIATNIGFVLNLILGHENMPIPTGS